MSDNSGLVVAALKKTQPVLSTAIDVDGSYITWIRQIAARVQLFRMYERGDHRASVSEQMKRMLRIKGDESGMTDFNDNYCSIIVDKMAGRIHVTEVSITDTDNDQWLSEVLDKNSWVALQSSLWRSAIRDSSSYIMVDIETSEWCLEQMFDGYSGIFAMFYGSSPSPYWACKIWSEERVDNDKETMRVVVYEPTRISFWRGEEGGNELVEDYVVAPSDNGQDEPKTNVSMWAASRIPIVRFINKYDPSTDAGESEIRPAIPLQDVLNRTLHSMVMASEFSAFTILWSKGIEIDVNGITPGAVINLLLKDSSGKPIAEPTPEMIAYLNAVQVGQFQGTNIGQYIEQIDKLVREISQSTSTPIYGITNQGAVSGEALRQLEIGLIGKCERFQYQNTDAIKTLVLLTAEIQNLYDTGWETQAPKFSNVTVVWKSPEILDVTSRVIALVNMRRDAPGLWDDDFYRSRIGGLLGLTQSDVSKESVKASDQQIRLLANLTGSDGQIPPVQ